MSVSCYMHTTKLKKIKSKFERKTRNEKFILDSSSSKHDGKMGHFF